MKVTDHQRVSMSKKSPPSPVPDMVLLISRTERGYAKAVNELIRTFRNNSRIMVVGRSHFVVRMKSEKDVVRVELKYDQEYPV